MRKKWQLIISGSVVLLVISCLYLTLKDNKNVEMKLVLTVIKDIKKGEEITQDMIKVIEIPEELIPNAVCADDDFIGKSAGRDIFISDILVDNDLDTEHKKNDYPKVEPGKRLYSLLIKPEQANGCWLFENSMIDLFVQLPYFSDNDETTEDIREVIASTVYVVENVRIVRIMDENGEEIGDDSGSSRILSLELEPETIKIIAASVKTGAVSIAAISD